MASLSPDGEGMRALILDGSSVGGGRKVCWLSSVKGMLYKKDRREFVSISRTERVAVGMERIYGERQ